MKRYTIGQQRALVELRALARTALMVCDALAARGEESDDRPRRYLDALVRLTRDEDSAAEHHHKRAVLLEARVTVFGLPLPEVTP